MSRSTSYCITAGIAGAVALLSPSGPAGEVHAQPDRPDSGAPFVQFLGTKAGTGYQDYAPAEPRSIFGYAMLHVPPNTVIDFAQDARDKMRHWGVAEEAIDNILLTHSHFDHYDAPTILAFARDRWQEFGRKTNAFASETVHADLQKASAEAGAQEFLIVTKVAPGDRISLADDVAATVLPSSHWTAPTPVQFLLEFHGREVLYAVDSAALREEDFAALQGHCLDLVIMDCTYHDREVDPKKSGHMNYSMVAEQMAALKERGLARESAPCYIPHLISIDYRQGASAAREYGLRMAYDGMRVLCR